MDNKIEIIRCVQVLCVQEFFAYFIQQLNGSAFFDIKKSNFLKVQLSLCIAHIVDLKAAISCYFLVSYGL